MRRTPRSLSSSVLLVCSCWRRSSTPTASTPAIDFSLTSDSFERPRARASPAVYKLRQIYRKSINHASRETRANKNDSNLLEQFDSAAFSSPRLQTLRRSHAPRLFILGRLSFDSCDKFQFSTESENCTCGWLENVSLLSTPVEKQNAVRDTRRRWILAWFRDF